MNIMKNSNIFTYTRYYFKFLFFVNNYRTFNKNKIIIPRSFDNNLALGRIDRADWEATKNKKTIKIDAHLPRPFNKNEADLLLLKYHNSKI